MTLLYPSFLWLLIPLVMLLRKRTKSIIFLIHFIILILLVLSLSRPVYEESMKETPIMAKDIIIALDISYSMRASDLEPTRYEFAKETIQSILSNNVSDNIMLIAFTTNPLLLSPPTTDHTLVYIALESINPEYILTKGTSLENLFKKLASLKQGHKNLILMTDGGEENDTQSLVSLLQKANISLTTLALGSTKGTTVQTKEGKLLKDKEGNLVVSRINPLLETLTHSLGGKYLTASSNPQSTAEKITHALKADESSTMHIQKMQRHYLELYQIPLLLAALLFLVLHTRMVKYLVILVNLFGFQAEASLFDDYHLHQAVKAYQAHDFNSSVMQLKKIDTPSLQSQLTLANSYYKMQAYKKAIMLYMSIKSTSPKMKQDLYHNTANAYVMLGKYAKAKIYYTKALQLGSDEASLYNLALISKLKDKVAASLGIAHPKSQSSASSKSESSEKEKKHEEDEPSSGSGGSGEKTAQEKQKKNKLISDPSAPKQPLGSKAYELINKGYIRETQPW